MLKQNHNFNYLLASVVYLLIFNVAFCIIFVNYFNNMNRDVLKKTEENVSHI